MTLSRANIVEEIILIAEPSHFMAIFILLGLLFDHDQVPSLVRLMGYDQRWIATILAFFTFLSFFGWKITAGPCG